MPFTLSHPIATLPLRWLTGGRLPLSALFIGAMVPDIAYFIALTPTGTLGHTLTGVIIEGLPAGMILYLMWRYLLRTPLCALLPSAMSCRVMPSRELPRGALVTLLLVPTAILLGALTHLLWDSFTHPGAWGVTRLPLLEERLGPLPLYKWNQYLGGALGALGLMLWGGWRLRAASPRELVDSERVTVRVRVVAVGFIALCAGALSLFATTLTTNHSPHALLVRAVIGLVSGGGVGATFYAATFWLIYLKNKNKVAMTR